VASLFQLWACWHASFLSLMGVVARIWSLWGHPSYHVLSLWKLDLGIRFHGHGIEEVCPIGRGQPSRVCSIDAHLNDKECPDMFRSPGDSFDRQTRQKAIDW